MNHAKPDELLELDKITGAATIVAEKSGEAIPVSCDLRLYLHMLWCGDAFPRVEGVTSIKGRVWKSSESFWAHVNIGERFFLVSGDRKLHFFIIDDSGEIGNIDSNWPV